MNFQLLSNPWRWFILTFALIFISVSVTAQQAPDPGVAFDKAYWLSQPPQVRALNPITNEKTPEQIQELAVELAIKGFKIDVPIMVWSMDPYKVMRLRADYGYTWVPNALQARVQAAPGLTGPGIVPYDPNNPPGGAIKVSTNIADYPPFDPPAPVVSTKVGTILVGANSIGKLYLTVPYDSSPDGTKYVDERGTFIKHLVASPFGAYAWWEKQ